MKIVYFRDRRGNFGDDLNPLIWNSLLAGHGRAPDLHLVGIGSILNSTTFAAIKPETPLVILGSGASYGPPPHLMKHWRILAVRGPLSARLIGRPSAAVTDGAILLAACPGLVRPPDPLRQGGVVFMPHAMSSGPQWRAAAARAGMDYADPTAPVAATLALLAGARLVITEAMHGAIVADTLRVPWMPVRISPRFDLFKWQDWALSLDVPLAPVDLPSAGLVEMRRNRLQAARFEATGTGDTLPFGPEAARDVMIAYLERRHRGQPYAQPQRVRPASAARDLARGAVDLLDPLFEARAAAALRRVAGGPAYLSHDRLYDARLARMMRGVDKVRALIGIG